MTETTLGLTSSWLRDTGLATRLVIIPRLIRLDVDQVEHLRALAKKDEVLREILKEFTPYIQVVVEFG